MTSVDVAARLRALADHDSNLFTSERLLLREAADTLDAQAADRDDWRASYERERAANAETHRVLRERAEAAERRLEQAEQRERELGRVVVECQRQLRERDDQERRDSHLRQLADEECVRADAMFERAEAAEGRLEQAEHALRRARAFIADDEWTGAARLWQAETLATIAAALAARPAAEKA